MPIQTTGLVGSVGPFSDGTMPQAFRQGKYGDQSVSELQPRYYEQAYRGNVFFAAHQAATTFSANGLTSASAVGFCLYNPAQSSKNLVPVQVEAIMTNFVTTSTDVQLVAVVSQYAAAAPSTATALTIYQALGAVTGKSQAIAAVSLTFAANPIVWKQIFSSFVTTTIAAAIPTPNGATPYDFGGTIIIPPGTGIAVVSSNASTGLVSMSWMELAI